MKPFIRNQKVQEIPDAHTTMMKTVIQMTRTLIIIPIMTMKVRDRENTKTITSRRIKTNQNKTKNHIEKVARSKKKRIGRRG